ncbi:MAG: TSUP family transporter [Verrucomicrobiota bacterium]
MENRTSGDPKNDAEPLRGFRAFAGADPAALRALSDATESVTVNAGDLIIQKGDQSDAFYLILKGEFEVFVTDPTEPVATLSQYDIFGEVGILRKSKRTANVRAAADGKLLRVPRERFLSIVSKHPSLRRSLARRMASYAQAMTLNLTAFDPALIEAERNLERPDKEARNFLPSRIFLYPIALFLLTATWVVYVTLTKQWPLMVDHWEQALTMVFGSFVAGSTPAGGGAVAFPVFTKLLGVDVSVARDHSLMIQSIGMVMASIFIFSRRIPVYLSVIVWALPAGVVGFLIGSQFQTEGLAGKSVFSSILLVFGVAYALAHWVLRFQPTWEFTRTGPSSRILKLIVGFLGGWIVSIAGSGIDLICFILMVIGFGLDERRAVPTTVVIMASLSVIGTVFRLMQSDENPITSITFQYWLVCVPVVAVGAPLGALVVSKINRLVLIWAVLFLVAVDVVTTIGQFVTEPATLQDWTVFASSVMGASLGIGFLVLKRHRAALQAKSAAEAEKKAHSLPDLRIHVRSPGLASWEPVSISAAEIENGIVIGRSSKLCNVVIRDASVSRKHLWIYPRFERVEKGGISPVVQIESLSAGNGTEWLGGAKRDTTKGKKLTLRRAYRLQFSEEGRYRIGNAEIWFEVV